MIKKFNDIQDFIKWRITFMEFGNTFSPFKRTVRIRARPGWMKQRQSGGNALRRAADQNLPGRERS